MDEVDAKERAGNIVRTVEGAMRPEYIRFSGEYVAPVFKVLLARISELEKLDRMLNAIRNANSGEQPND